MMMNKKKKALSSPWPDLQPELLGLVLLWLPSLLDRVRLRAVCRSWRSNARMQPLPPPLPWLILLDGTSLSIPDGKIVRVPAPDDAFCCGSIDSCLFFVHTDGRCSLMNPFSKAMLDLPKWFNVSSTCPSSFDKVVVPSSLESSPGSTAVLIGHTHLIFQPPFATKHIEAIQSNYLVDIAFFNGKLYGLDHHGELSIFEINCGLDSKPKISRVKCITASPTTPLILRVLPFNFKGCLLDMTYLVECCGRLLVVLRLIECDTDTIHRTPLATTAFGVFEADLSTKPGRWRRVTKLDGQALFIGKHCSKSFPAGEYTGLQGDCIYFMCDYHEEGLAVDPLHDSGVYNMRDKTITPLLSETATMPQHRVGQWRPTWLFPTDAM